MTSQHQSRLLLALAILFSCVGCDQATKTVATFALRDQLPRSYFADTVRFEYAQNPGGFLSVGANLPEIFRTSLFIVTNCTLMLGIIVVLTLKRNIPLALFVSLVFVLAGGVGNLLDRVSNRGLVTDFMNIGVGPLRTGVFNVADMAITFGVAAIAILTLRIERDDKGIPRTGRSGI